MRSQLIVLFLVPLYWVHAQKTTNFSQQVTFEYQKEGKKQEFSAFVEPKTGTWLLTRDDTFGGQPDDINYWVLKPNGQIIIVGMSDTDKKQQIVLQNHAFKFGTKTLNAKATGKKQRFGQNIYGWKTYLASEYQTINGRSQTQFFATQLPFDCRALLAYNSCVDIENHLPNFGGMEYYKILPPNYLILQDRGIKLVSISPTEYFVELGANK